MTFSFLEKVDYLREIQNYIKNNNLAGVKHIIENGHLDVNDFMFCDNNRRRLVTILGLTMLYFRINIVWYLLDKGASINRIIDGSEEHIGELFLCPWLSKCDKEKEMMFNVLIKYGFDVNCKIYKQFEQFHYRRCVEYDRKVLKFNVSFFYICCMQSVSITRLVLLTRKVKNINKRYGYYAMTCLHVLVMMAVRGKRTRLIELIKLMFDQGAFVDIENVYGETVLDTYCNFIKYCNLYWYLGENKCRYKEYTYHGDVDVFNDGLFRNDEIALLLSNKIKQERTLFSYLIRSMPDI